MNFEDLTLKINELIKDETKARTICSDFRTYFEFLVEENSKYNLTAITLESEVIAKHFYDSILPLFEFSFAGKKVIDVGTGAGFPGIPLLLCCPSINLTLVEPTTKRCVFLKALCLKLKLDNVTILNARSEDLPHNYIEKFDIGVSRAVSHLNIISELVLPFVKVNGYFIAYKGASFEEEIKEAGNCFKKLESKIENITKYMLDTDTIPRALIYLKKLKKIEHKYPRAYAAIKANPLK
ncbi:MAG: 16S rRNA (guanine(527)-N(7))-methyltransferase RsmG [Bacilli bacterium]